MKANWQNKGATYLEIMIALAILAVLITAFMPAFLFTERGTVATGEVLSATFIAQSEIERFMNLDFRTALIEGNNVRRNVNDFYVATEVTPFRNNAANVFNVVIKDSATNLIMATPVPGAYTLIESISSNLVLDLSPNAGDLIIVNAVMYSGTHNVTLNITSGGSAALVHVYDTRRNHTRIRIQGVVDTQIRRFRDFTTRNFSVVRVRTSVFESMVATAPKATIETVMELGN